MSKQCGTCKWHNQTKDCAACFNPKQTDQSLKDYSYYNFSCGLHEKGNTMTEKEMNALGYSKHFETIKLVDGTETHVYAYYTPTINQPPK